MKAKEKIKNTYNNRKIHNWKLLQHINNMNMNEPVERLTIVTSKSPWNNMQICRKINVNIIEFHEDNDGKAAKCK